jgi:MFS family permease
MTTISGFPGITTRRWAAAGRRTGTPPATAAAIRTTVATGAFVAACALCGGLLGLIAALLGRRRGRRPSRRLVLAVGAGAAVQVAAGCHFATTAVLSPPDICRPTSLTPATAQRFTTDSGRRGHDVRTAITAPVSGAVLAYARVKGADLCHFAPNSVTTARVTDGFARGGTMYGTVFLTDPKPAADPARLLALKAHEGRHADQWAVLTALAGPLAFPLSYGAVESLFPGAHNHFERHAGLAAGGYDLPHDEPPAGSRLLFLVVGLLAGYLAARRGLRRRTGAAPRRRPAYPPHRSPYAGAALHSPHRPAAIE